MFHNFGTRSTRPRFFLAKHCFGRPPNRINSGECRAAKSVKSQGPSVGKPQELIISPMFPSQRSCHINNKKMEKPTPNPQFMLLVP